MFEIRERDVPEQLVLTETRRHVTQAELPEVNRATMQRVARLADGSGGAAGPIFAVFHDEEYDPADITFEICIPIASAAGLPGDTPVRTIAAHREAYVRLRKRETVPPTIGEGYQAVSRWIVEQGRTGAGAPREVYFADYGAAGEDDEVFDVAFPIR